LKHNCVGKTRLKYPQNHLIHVFASFLILFLAFSCLASSLRLAYAVSLVSTAQTETTVTLSWGRSGILIGFSNYKLYESTDVNGPYTNIWSTGDQGKTAHAVSGLSSNTNYYFYVTDEGFLQGPFQSNTLQVTTTSNPQLTVTAYDYSSATLTWTDYNTIPYSSLEPFVSYILQTSNSASGPWSTVTTITDPSQNSYRQMGLFHQTYYFRMYDTVGPSGDYQSSYSNTVNVAIPVAPTMVITASATTLDAGQPVQLSSSISGGLPPYSHYQWYSNNTAIAGATSTSYTWTPKTAGTYYIKASVQDTLGIPVDSNQIMVVVNTLPIISISASTTSLAVGEQTTFTSTTSGGAPPYSLRWYSNGNPIEGATASSYIFAPTEGGTYNIYATVQDYYNGTASSNAIQVTVTAPLAANASVSGTALTVGQLAQFSVSASGGAPPYTYQWYVDGNPIEGANSTSFIYSPTDAGTHNVYAGIRDGANKTASSNTIQVTVTAPSSLPLSPWIIAAIIGVIVVIIVAALVFRSLSRRKIQKTQANVSDNQPKT